MAQFINKPTATVLKTVVYKTETYKVLPGLMLEVSYADGVITGQKFVALPSVVKRNASPLAYRIPMRYALVTDAYLEALKTVPWWDAYSNGYEVTDILQEFQANGIPAGRIIGISAENETYAWGEKIPLQRVFGGSSTTLGISEKRIYGPVKWHYKEVLAALRAHPQISDFTEEDANRYDRDTDKRIMCVNNMLITYTAEQVQQAHDYIVKYFEDNNYVLGRETGHRLFHDVMCLKEVLPGLDLLGLNQYVKSIKYDFFEKIPRKQDKAAS